MREFDPPIVINVRDRVTPLRALVQWLEQAGHERIVLLDNASTYEPLRDYLADTPHRVVRLDHNAGSRGIWATPQLIQQRGWFVYTDPDIIPIPDCPHDAVDHLHRLLIEYPDQPKAALGLHLDDVPASMPALDWELRLLHPLPGDEWKGQLRPGVYDSLSDTTFALYRPNSGFTLQSIRTGWPYQARHASPAWYGGPLSTEDIFYLEHADGGPQGSSWKDACD